MLKETTTVAKIKETYIWPFMKAHFQLMPGVYNRIKVEVQDTDDPSDQPVPLFGLGLHSDKQDFNKLAVPFKPLLTLGSNISSRPWVRISLETIDV